MTTSLLKLLITAKNSRCSCDFLEVCQQAKNTPSFSAWPLCPATMLFGHLWCTKNNKKLPFSIGAVFLEKFGKQYCLFSEWSKKRLFFYLEWSEILPYNKAGHCQIMVTRQTDTHTDRYRHRLSDHSSPPSSSSKNFRHGPFL